MEKQINVNELNRLLGSDMIIEVLVAGSENQHNPHVEKVGVGGILTIKYEK